MPEGPRQPYDTEQAERWEAMGPETGTILVDVPVPGCAAGAVLYARVSSHDRRADLDRQVARLTGWATAHGIVVAGVVREAGSGLNGKRPKLRRVLSDPSATVIVVGTGTGWRVSGWSIWTRRWRRRAAGCWWPMLARGLMTWCGT
jgi:Resolvase, N terminal domain